MNITVLTPTFNRADTLPRVYNSLLNQTKKDFVWLIVDDGSTDETELTVKNWIEDKIIEIVYYKIKKGGQHKALQLGYNKATTKYLVKIDSDDAFVPQAIEIYLSAWARAEKENKNIGNITALSVYENGDLDGNWEFPTDVKYIDSTWHEMILKKDNRNELSNCTRTSILKQIYPPGYTFWHEEKVNIIDGVFAPRISKKCITRYLNTVVQTVYLDAPFSSLRSIKTDSTKFWRVILDNKYFLDENLNYFFWRPKYFIHLILKFIISGIELKFTPVFIVRKIETFRFKLAYVLFYPFGLILWFYFKHIKKQFWF